MQTFASSLARPRRKERSSGSIIRKKDSRHSAIHRAGGFDGGHPVLAQAGVEAIRYCKWDAATHETKEIVIFNFHPN